MNESINILDENYSGLSPFSAHPVTVRGVAYPTVEHAYQALRIKPGPEQDAIGTAPSALAAWQEGQKHKNNPILSVEDFDKDAVMEELFRAKIAQHPEVASLLVSTGERELLKIHDDDYYWGTGKDGSGENRMGKLWMKLRSK